MINNSLDKSFYLKKLIFVVSDPGGSFHVLHDFQGTRQLPQSVLLDLQQTHCDSK